MSRKVEYARTHQGVYVPDAGELGSTFPPQSKTLDNLTMHTDHLGLLLSFTYRGKHKEVIIPSANVIALVLAPEEKPIASVKAVKSA